MSDPGVVLVVGAPGVRDAYAAGVCEIEAVDRSTVKVCGWGSGLWGLMVSDLRFVGSLPPKVDPVRVKAWMADAVACRLVVGASVTATASEIADMWSAAVSEAVPKATLVGGG